MTEIPKHLLGVLGAVMSTGRALSFQDVQARWDQLSVAQKLRYLRILHHDMSSQQREVVDLMAFLADELKPA